ncbi:hypothetical protein [Arsenophonus sp.]|uniref:hypothetical protein n=1 Tax=Arsenophonus sp. TaxID=1872640 RepID=UPI0038795C62
MKRAETLRLIGKPHAYYPNLAKPLGGLTSAIIFSQIFYWQDKATSELGIYKTRDEFEEETGLTHNEQRTAIKKLVAIGVLLVTEKRLEHKTYYKIDEDKLNEILDNFANSKKYSSRDEESLHPELYNVDVGETIKSSSFYQEITTKNTTNNKNILIEPVRSEVEKTESEITKPNQNPIDLAFEGIFWPQVQRKVGKQSAKSSFKTQFRLWRKETGKTAEQFAEFLVADIRLRLQAKQFGFEKLHPATYLNGKRWLDDKPVIQSHQLKPQATTTSTFTVSNGLVFF